MTTRRSQLQEDTNYRVLRMLQDNPDLTQREIARGNDETQGYQRAVIGSRHADFEGVEFDSFKNQAGANSFTLSPT